MAGGALLFSLSAIVCSSFCRSVTAPVFALCLFGIVVYHPYAEIHGTHFTGGAAGPAEAENLHEQLDKAIFGQRAAAAAATPLHVRDAAAGVGTDCRLGEQARLVSHFALFTLVGYTLSQTSRYPPMLDAVYVGADTVYCAKVALGIAVYHAALLPLLLLDAHGAGPSLAAVCLLAAWSALFYRLVVIDEVRWQTRHSSRSFATSLFALLAFSTLAYNGARPLAFAACHFAAPLRSTGQQQQQQQQPVSDAYPAHNLAVPLSPPPPPPQQQKQQPPWTLLWQVAASEHDDAVACEDYLALAVAAVDIILILALRAGVARNNRRLPVCARLYASDKQMALINRQWMGFSMHSYGTVPPPPTPGGARTLGGATMARLCSAAARLLCIFRQQAPKKDAPVDSDVGANGRLEFAQEDCQGDNEWPEQSRERILYARRLHEARNAARLRERHAAPPPLGGVVQVRERDATSYVDAIDAEPAAFAMPAHSGVRGRVARDTTTSTPTRAHLATGSPPDADAAAAATGNAPRTRKPGTPNASARSVAAVAAPPPPPPRAAEADRRHRARADLLAATVPPTTIAAGSNGVAVVRHRVQKVEPGAHGATGSTRRRRDATAREQLPSVRTTAAATTRQTGSVGVNGSDVGPIRATGNAPPRADLALEPPGQVRNPLRRWAHEDAAATTSSSINASSGGGGRTTADGSGAGGGLASTGLGFVGNGLSHTGYAYGAHGAPGKSAADSAVGGGGGGGGGGGDATTVDDDKQSTGTVIF